MARRCQILRPPADFERIIRNPLAVAMLQTRPSRASFRDVNYWDLASDSVCTDRSIYLVNAELFVTLVRQVQRRRLRYEKHCAFANSSADHLGNFPVLGKATCGGYVDQPLSMTVNMQQIQRFAHR